MRTNEQQEQRKLEIKKEFKSAIYAANMAWLNTNFTSSEDVNEVGLFNDVFSKEAGHLFPPLLAAVCLLSGRIFFPCRDQKGDVNTIKVNGIAVITYLIKKGAFVSYQIDPNLLKEDSVWQFGGCTALSYAAYFGWAECVGLLLESGHKNLPLTRGVTPLALASAANHLPVVEVLSNWLINQSLMVDDCNVNGRTPAIMALLHGYVEVFEYLVSRGACNESVITIPSSVGAENQKPLKFPAGLLFIIIRNEAVRLEDYILKGYNSEGVHYIEDIGTGVHDGQIYDSHLLPKLYGKMTDNKIFSQNCRTWEPGASECVSADLTAKIHKLATQQSGGSSTVSAASTTTTAAAAAGQVRLDRGVQSQAATATADVVSTMPSEKPSAVAAVQALAGQKRKDEDDEDEDEDEDEDGVEPPPSRGPGAG